MYVHSVKVPRLYKDAAKVLQQAKENGSSVKKLIFESKHCNKKALIALVNETLRRFSEIDSLIEKVKLLTKETRFNPWLARVLITELLWGKKHLPDQSVPLKTLLIYHKKLEKYKLELVDSPSKERPKLKVNKPRVVRVNTILDSVENVVNELKNDDWKLMPFAGESYEDFVSQTALLKNGQFMIDLHFQDLLQFPSNTEFHKHKAYKNGSLVLQDKASCLPTRLLNPEPGSIVLDMCAAPGMKTTHLAALLNNQGSVYAVERDAKRFETLNTMVKKLKATCVKTINNDVLKVTEKDCPNVKYILVDPSCSGSGMTGRIDFNKNPQPTEERLEKLAGFQILILKHALKHFPNAQRVVYSTCSTYSKENEYVVQEVLKNELDFKLVNANALLEGSWKSNNSDENFKGITENCLSMKPEKDLTNGFFVAVFERTGNSHKKKSKKSTDDSANTKTKKKEKVADTTNTTNGNLNKSNKKQKKRERAESLDVTLSANVPEVKKAKLDDSSENLTGKPKSHKKNKKQNKNEDGNTSGPVETSTPHIKKSKKHNKTFEGNQEVATTLNDNKNVTFTDENFDAIKAIIDQKLDHLNTSKVSKENNASIVENQDSEKTKSKKKKNISILQDISIPPADQSLQLETPSRKKHKKAKHVNDAALDLSQVQNESQVDEGSTKKKKKHKRKSHEADASL